MKNNRLILLITVVLLTGILGFICWAKTRYIVPILTYHHVGQCANPVLRLNTVSTETFERQMAFLKKHGYKVIDFDDLVQGIKEGARFAPNTVVIHFDDGYEDNYINAFPILKKYQFPAMVFLVSDAIGTPGFMSWEQVEDLERYDFLAGAHTRTHQHLPDLSVEKAREEIQGSKRIIESKLGHRVDYFVYPSGGFNDQVKSIVAEAGYKAAATTNRGRDRLNRDVFELNRIRMKDSDQGFVLWAKLSGYYNLFRQPKTISKEDMILK